MGQSVANVECACGHVGRLVDQDLVRRMQLGYRPVLRCVRCGSTERVRLTFGYDAGVNPFERHPSGDRDGEHGDDVVILDP